MRQLGRRSIRPLSPPNTKCGFRSREDRDAWSSSSWFQIQFLQLLPHLSYLIRLCFSAGSRLQIYETRSALKDDVAAFCFARRITNFRQQRTQVGDGKECT